MGAGARARSSRIALALAGAALALAGLALLAWPPRAFADVDFCPPGEGAGQCGLAPFQNSPRGLSIDFEDNLIFVADRSNNRVSVFTEERKFVRSFGWGVADGSPELQVCGPATPELEPDPSLCRKGLEGAGAGQMKGPTDVAVDNVAGSASKHAVYVLDEGNKRILKFTPAGAFVWATGSGGEAEGQIATGPSLGVGPGGEVHLLDNLSTGVSLKYEHRLQRFDPATGAVIPSQCILREGGRALDLAVASDGAFWVVNEQNSKGLRKYDESCAPLPIDGGEEVVETDFTSAAGSIAVDGADRVFLAANEKRVAASGSFQAITARDATGAPLARFAYGRVPSSFNPEGLAVGAAGAFYGFGAGAFEIAGIRLLEQPSPPLPPPGPIAAPPSLEALSVGAAKATVSAEVNPEGDSTEVHFDYVSTAAYEEDKAQGGDGFEGPEAKSSPTETLATEGFRLEAIEAQIGCPDPLSEAGHPGETALQAGECLTPETEHHWRIVAENGAGEGEGTVEGPPFTTRSSPEIGDVYSSEAGADTAKLSAEVNPWGVPTTGYFEYVTEAQFGASEFAEATKVPDVDAAEQPLQFGAAEDLATRSVTLGSLAPGGAYRYRIVAENPLAEAAASQPHTLQTFSAPERGPCANEEARIGLGALLPDCRAYELVSPIDKEGGDIRVVRDSLEQLAVLEQATDSGGRLAYGSSRPFGDAPSGPFTSQYVSQRVDGVQWRSHAITPPRGAPLFGAPGQLKTELKALSADLCQGWFATYAEFPPPAPPGYEPGVQNLLLRNDRLCGAEGFTATAPRVAPAGGAEVLLLKLAGVSADGAHSIFTSNDRLEPDGHCETTEGNLVCANQLYVSAGAEAPRLVCYHPSASPFAGPCTAGTYAPNGARRSFPNAISADGERVFFSVGGDGAQPLYVRVNPTEPEESPRVNGAAYGSGDVIGEGSAKGRVLTSNPTKVTNVSEASGLAPGQEVSDSAAKIPAGTRILECLPDCLEPTELLLDGEVTGNSLKDEIVGHPSETLRAVAAEDGAFEAGQSIEGPGIPAGARIEAVAEPEPGVFELTLSEIATATSLGAPLGASSPCLRPLSGACTIAVSAANATFWGASADGATAIYTTGNLAGGAATLFSFDVDGEEATEIATGVRGVLGISADASRVYFASHDVLPESGQNSFGEEAVEGQPNLYFHEAGAGTEFIATLDGADVEAAVSDESYGEHSSRVTADGLHAAFASVAPLSGYDNIQATGTTCLPSEPKPQQPCNEIYRYDAAAGELRCASCNPSGARPMGPSAIPFYLSPLHSARLLSEDGARLYFESADRLAARDTNGRIDVYQWEQPGSGTCTAGSYDFSAQAGGCVSLISSGQGSLDSRFVEADAEGSDVFFTTGSSLLPQDPGLVDIYDARANGGLPVPPDPTPPCEGDACAPQIAAPEAPEPASEGYEPPPARPATGASRCTRSARLARRQARGAKRLKRASRRGAPARRRALRRRAASRASRARRLSRAAKRCRARARAARRAGR